MRGVLKLDLKVFQHCWPPLSPFLGHLYRKVVMGGNGMYMGFQEEVVEGMRIWDLPTFVCFSSVNVQSFNRFSKGPTTPNTDCL